MFNEFKWLRNKTGLTQQAFCEKFNIPIGTFRNWEQGISTPPKYVYDLLETAVRYHDLWSKEREENNEHSLLGM